MLVTFVYPYKDNCRAVQKLDNYQLTFYYLLLKTYFSLKLLWWEVDKERMQTQIQINQSLFVKKCAKANLGEVKDFLKL